MLSGDVHTGVYGEVVCQEKGDDPTTEKTNNLGRMVQLTASGIVAHPHGNTKHADMGLSLLPCEWEDRPGLRSRCLPPDKTDKRQAWNKFLCERNFLRLDPAIDHTHDAQVDSLKQQHHPRMRLEAAWFVHELSHESHGMVQSAKDALMSVGHSTSFMGVGGGGGAADA